MALFVNLFYVICELSIKLFNLMVLISFPLWVLMRSGDHPAKQNGVQAGISACGNKVVQGIFCQNMVKMRCFCGFRLSISASRDILELIHE